MGQGRFSPLAFLTGSAASLCCVCCLAELSDAHVIPINTNVSNSNKLVLSDILHREIEMHFRFMLSVKYWREKQILCQYVTWDMCSSCILNSLVLRIHSDILPWFWMLVWRFLNNIYLLFCWSILFHYILLCEVIEDSWKLYVRDIPKEISWSSDHKSTCFEKFHWWYSLKGLVDESSFLSSCELLRIRFKM